jgi:hypothetical protein
VNIDNLFKYLLHIKWQYAGNFEQNSEAGAWPTIQLGIGNPSATAQLKSNQRSHRVSAPFSIATGL